MPENEHFSIKQTIKGKLPSLPFEGLKNTILGKRYTLSLVFIGDKRSQKLNTRYRKKNKPANILSFPLSDSLGEIFINPHEARRHASQFNMTEIQFIGYLFIHGLLHLKGYEHGGTMSKEEKKFLKKFNM